MMIEDAYHGVGSCDHFSDIMGSVLCFAKRPSRALVINKPSTIMARQIRKKSGTGIYHIMLRGIPLMIQSLENVRRNEILITAKAMEAGLRQLSRLTGVSFGVIQRQSIICLHEVHNSLPRVLSIVHPASYSDPPNYCIPRLPRSHPSISHFHTGTTGIPSSVPSSS